MMMPGKQECVMENIRDKNDEKHAKTSTVPGQWIRVY